MSVDNRLSRQSNIAIAEMRKKRRQVINRFVESLTEILEIAASCDQQKQPLPVVQFTAEIRALTEKLAAADDAMLSELVQDAALLLHSLERCRRDMAEKAGNATSAP